jgi:hypothetical protein
MTTFPLPFDVVRSPIVTGNVAALAVRFSVDKNQWYGTLLNGVLSLTERLFEQANPGRCK